VIRKLAKKPGGATAVGAGILISKLLGLVRERVLAQYLGVSPAADALRAAIRIPNLLQNLLGEGVLSASFIPAYSKLLGEGKHTEARKLALSLLTFIIIVVSALVVLGVYFSALLVNLLAPGFDVSTRVLTVKLLRILFPATGLLVVSAWCLGVHNSNRRFFTSYVAPAFWNLSIILVVLFCANGRPDGEAAAIAAIGYIVGAAVQIVVQVPQLLSSVRGTSLADFFSFGGEVQAVLRRFGPAFLGRGVVQISAYLDNIIASLIGPGSVALVSIVQTVYLLPISLFGMSIAAAELPELSRSTHSVEVLSDRLKRARKRLLLTVLPSMIGYIVLGDLVLTILFKGGRFSAEEVERGWFVLAAFSFGLLASALGRLNSSTLYALGDTKTPMRIATIRVTLSTLLAVLLCLILPRYVVIPDYLAGGCVMLGLASSIGAIVENKLLRTQVEKLGVVIRRERQGWIILCVSVLLAYIGRLIYLRFISFSS
jgi:putative peptidoglycan lipid II flippase